MGRTSPKKKEVTLTGPKASYSPAEVGGHWIVWGRPCWFVVSGLGGWEKPCRKHKKESKKKRQRLIFLKKIQIGRSGLRRLVVGGKDGEKMGF